jgi:putative PIN family toxin of toxin-antitoxin system
VRAVLDTNVSLRGFFRATSAPGRVIAALVDNRLTLVSSEPLLAELQDVLSRPKVRSKYGATQEDADEFIALLRDQADMVSITGASQGCRDPKDDAFIETALAGRADVIVSEDRDLLDMTASGQLVGVRVLTALQFLRELDPEE